MAAILEKASIWQKWSGLPKSRLLFQMVRSVPLLASLSLLPGRKNLSAIKLVSGCMAQLIKMEIVWRRNHSDGKNCQRTGSAASIIGRMVVTSPSDIVWLSPSELQSMGTKLTGKPSQLGGQPGGAVNLDAMHSKQLPSATAPTGSMSQMNWSQIVERAFALSTAQHAGTPTFVRNCQPELKICNMAVLFRSDAGKDMMVRAVEDLHGTMITREICEFNTFGDNRFCVNFDTKQTHRDLKDSQGNWSQVSTD